MGPSTGGKQPAAQSNNALLVAYMLLSNIDMPDKKQLLVKVYQNKSK